MPELEASQIPSLGDWSLLYIPTAEDVWWTDDTSLLSGDILSKDSMNNKLADIDIAQYAFMATNEFMR